MDSGDTKLRRTTEGNTVTQLLLLTRPYTWVDSVYTGILASTVASGRAPNAMSLVGIGAVTLLLWATLNWYSEFIQRDAGRARPPLMLAISPVLVVGTIVALWSATALALLIVHCLAIVTYPHKKKMRVLAVFGPAIRGLQTVTLFYLVAALTVPIDQLFWTSGLVPLWLFFLQIARSAVAEVRDSEDDTFGLPAECGNRATLLIALACMTIPILFVNSVAIVILVLLFLFSLLWIIAAVRHLPSAAYRIHQLFIVCTVLFKMSFLLEAAFAGVNVIGVLLTAALGYSYTMVPRPCNRCVTRSWVAFPNRKEGYRPTLGRPEEVIESPEGLLE